MHLLLEKLTGFGKGNHMCIFAKTGLEMNNLDKSGITNQITSMKGKIDIFSVELKRNFENLGLKVDKFFQYIFQNNCGHLMLHVSAPF